MAWLSFGTLPAQADTITFDAVPVSFNDLFTVLETDGFVFTSPHAHVINAPGVCDTGCADNGTQWIGGDASAVTMARADGSAFALMQLDAAEGLAGLNQPDALVLVARLAGGGMVSTTFGFDGINDSLGPLTDFQSFPLDPAWRQIVSLTFATTNDGWFGLDNLVVEQPPVIPEPATLMLLGTGLGVMAAARRARSNLRSACGRDGSASETM
jgi:hypothetical protein